MSKDEPRILVVDDDVDIGRNLADILIDLGYRVDTAVDGPTALELVRRTPYDVALLDLRMPGMDGLSLYREIKTLSAATVALIVTAYASGATAEAALAAGAWKVLAKPVDLPRLLRLVDEALGWPAVLVVDDDRELCANLWDLLHLRRCRLGLAHGETEAAERLREAQFDVVLVDLKLPDGDGDAVLRMVRRANPRARTVLISGYPAELDRAVARASGGVVDAICTKPFDVPRLLNTLKRLTEGGTETDRPTDSESE